MVKYFIHMPKVIVKLKNGEEITGEILSFNANLPTFHIHFERDKGKPESGTITMGSVKAVFFIKKETADVSVVHMETIEDSVFAGTHGFRLHVEFNDGEMVHGSAHKYDPNDKGFYLVPLNPADRYERIYVNALAVKRVDSRRLMGNILVDQKKITPTQLSYALRYQWEKREKKIGTILAEHNFITHGQLEESLQKQTERAKYLGEILLEAGYITEEQLQYALTVQRENKKKKLGQILVELKYLAPNDICIALATQLHLPWADLSTANILHETATALPEDVIRRLEVIPIEQKDDTLIVATAEPQAVGLIGELSRYTELKIELAVGYEGYIESTINRFFPNPEMN
jgi:mannitol/fructose-specific phosphotransferase system IIA component (Ntr-type)